MDAPKDLVESVVKVCLKGSGLPFGPNTIVLQHDAEERLKLLAIRLAFLEKIATRIGAVVLAWASTTVLGAFGYLLSFGDFCVVAFIAFAEIYRVFFRRHELELGSILRESGKGKSSGSVRVKRSHSHRFKRDFAVIPVPLVRRISQSWGLTLALRVAQRVTAAACIGLPIWRIVLHDFCPSHSNGDPEDAQSRTTCRISAYAFYSMAILGALLFLVEKGALDYQIYLKRRLKKVGERLLEGNVDTLVLENYLNAVYKMCIDGSIFDGFDTNLAEFGIQWLQSDDFEKEVHGAKLISGLISVKKKKNLSKEDSGALDVDKYKLSSDCAGSLRNFGSCPGLMDRLVAMLSWEPQHEKEHVDEIAAIMCNVVASEQNHLRFADVPGAVEAVVSLMIARTDEYKDSSNGNKEVKWETPVQLLCSLAASKTTIGSALRQQICGMTSVTNFLKEGLTDAGNPRLQLLSTEIVIHLALNKDARRSIGETETIIQSLFNLFGKTSSTAPTDWDDREPRRNPEGTNQSLMAGIALSRLVVNEANCRALIAIEMNSEDLSFGSLIENFLEGNHKCLAAVAAEILHRVWPYAETYTKQPGGQIALKNVVTGEIADTALYAASLGLASCLVQDSELALQEMGTSREVHFMNVLVEQLRVGPTISDIYKSTGREKEVQLYAVSPIRRYSVEMIMALAKRKYLRKERAESLQHELSNARRSICGVENFILLAGTVGCARYVKDMEALCDEAAAAIDKL